MHFWLLILSLSSFANLAIAKECVDLTPCKLGERSYHVKLPDEWDGVTPMPVMLHFHGWDRKGTLIIKHSRISGATRKRGVLLIAPNGRNKTWDFWAQNSPDTAFADDVIEDVAKRYPIDRSRLFITGYSYGSAMAWRYACESTTRIFALLSVSGTLDQNENCSNIPDEIRHVHGTRDTVMSFPFGSDGDIAYSVKLWREAKGCEDGEKPESWSATKDDVFMRTNWISCNGGGVVRLDVHSRGHFIPKGWFARQLDELL